jgi:hypothetical protein
MVIKFQCILMGSNNTFLFVTGMRGALDQSLLFHLPTMHIWQPSEQGSTWSQRHQTVDH